MEQLNLELDFPSFLGRFKQIVSHIFLVPCSSPVLLLKFKNRFFYFSPIFVFRSNSLRRRRQVSVDRRHGHRHVRDRVRVVVAAVGGRHGRHVVDVFVGRRRRREAGTRRSRHNACADVTQLVTFDVAVLLDAFAYL